MIRNIIICSLFLIITFYTRLNGQISYYPYATKEDILEFDLYLDYQQVYDFEERSVKINQRNLYDFIKNKQPENVRAMSLESYPAKSSPGSESLPELKVFENLIHLEVLADGENYIPQEISSLKKLKNLSIYIHDDTQVPVWLHKIKSLESLKLYISRSENISIPKSFYKLKGLKILDLRKNGAISKNIARLENLISLSLALDSVPTNISQLKNLKYLNVKDSEKTPYQSIYSMNWLKELHMEIDYKKDIQGIENLLNLDKLVIDTGNNGFLEEITMLSNLNFLEIYFNSGELPAGIANMTNLQFLHMYCYLQQMPDILLELKSLKCLAIIGKPINSATINDTLKEKVCIDYDAYY